jgi:hypothetical protein
MTGYILNINKKILFSVIGMGLFALSTIVGDWVIGYVLFFLLNMVGAAREFTCSNMIPLLVENASIYIIYSIAIHVLGRFANNKRPPIWWLINPLSNCLSALIYCCIALTYFSANSPPLYFALNGDVAWHVWIIISFSAAIFPFSGYYAIQRYLKRNIQLR